MSKKKHYVQTLYRFDELSATAKDKVAQMFSLEYDWAYDDLDSLKKFAQHFGCELKDYSIDWGNSNNSRASFRVSDLDMKEIDTRLSELGTFDPVTFRGHGDCKLTGYCADESAIDGFRQAFAQGELDMSELMQAGFHTWLLSSCENFDYQCSEECIAENCAANDYWFDEYCNLA